MEQQMILGVLIGILVLVSAFQAFQLAELSGRVQAVGGLVMAGNSYAPSTVRTQASGAQQAQLPSGVANSPDMVGGC